ncbi:MAG: glycosyltransferase family 2 protein [Corynebacterium sp.]|nr:glycosyltransferase family 2 protein [Corynebacterium sp.]
MDAASTPAAELDHPPIAVITVTYSPGEHLAEFVESVRAATTRPTVVILADNGSTDGVPEATAAASDGSVVFLPTGGNVGYGTAINIAARSLKKQRQAGEIDPDFFVVANPDVVFSAGSIDQLIACARRWPNAADVGPLIVEPDGSYYPSARAVPTLQNGIGHALFGHLFPNNRWTTMYRRESDMSRERPAGWLSGSCLLVRWEAFDEVGGFDERYFMYMEDVDLGDRFARAGYVNVLCTQATITHAQGHAASKHADTMLPAHHESAYRFQADRHAARWQAPLRWALWVGLRVRASVAVRLAGSMSTKCPKEDTNE